MCEYALRSLLCYPSLTLNWTINFEILSFLDEVIIQVTMGYFILNFFCNSVIVIKGIHQTCQEYRDYGNTESNSVLIDPDGSYEPVAPFPVYCEITVNPPLGITVRRVNFYTGCNYKTICLIKFNHF